MIHASVCAAYGFAIEELTEGRTLGRPLVKASLWAQLASHPLSRNLLSLWMAAVPVGNAYKCNTGQNEFAKKIIGLRSHRLLEPLIKARSARPFLLAMQLLVNTETR
jgi:hypothetical protein